MEEIEKQLSTPGAWDDHAKMTPLLQEKTRLESQVERWESMLASKEELEEWLEFAQAEASKEGEQDVLQTLSEQLSNTAKRLDDVEMNLLLSGPGDDSAALLELHPGAGGTEAQDWAEMLMRMYRKWAEDHDYQIKILDYLPGDEAGVKSVVMQIAGPNAYGFLKAEKGVHRLIRISPFDSSGRRHTSFASVDVYPDAEQDIEIEIKEEDLRVDVFRSSGPGGQSVNTTSSAVRVTHTPTGIVAQCQNEKSQLRNKETALKILKARLYELELEKIQDERQSEYDSKEAIAWGSQIRTYTLQPYRLVKDHRTNTEVGDVDAVLDGKLDSLMRDYLLQLHTGK